MSKKPSISMNVTIKAAPEDIFAALTNSKIILEWCGQKGNVEAKIGGKFEMFDGWVKGKVLAYEPGRSLAYTWHPAEWQKEWDASIVTYALTKTKSGTKISLKHSGFPNEQEMKSHHSGWDKHVFEPLKEFFKA